MVAVRAFGRRVDFVTVIGATGALFLGILGSSERHQACRRVLDAVAARLHDRRVGRIRLRDGIFHLMTHACSTLLFLGAGSAIIAMHHDQDMRRMGGLRKPCRSPTSRC
jgi:NADH-quinone oxidoreductase subunit L